MRKVWIALFLTIQAANGLGQDKRLEILSPEHRAWIEEEVVYIVSDREREVFLSLETLEEREFFIRAFWKKRDPNRSTPKNEFKEEHYRRLAYANANLGRETSLRGWQTDQGKMYIILGEPIEIQRFDGYRQLVPTHLWFYQGGPTSGLPPFFYLVFFQKFGSGGYQLYHPVIDGPRALLVTSSFSGISNLGALEELRQVSAELMRASLSFDPSDPGDVSTGRGSLGVDALISKVYDSPTRAVRTDYADAWLRYGRKVASDYSFNFVPNRQVFAVLAGPERTPFVHYSIELDSENFTLETDERRTRYYTTVEVSVEVMNREGRLIEADDKEIYIELSPSQAQQVGALPFAFQEAFPLVPGEYNVTVILRNRAVKEYTVAEQDLRVNPIPNGTPWLSEVVLGYRSERSTGDLDEAGHRVFQIGGLVVHPAADRTFFLGETLDASVQVLGAPPEHRLDFALFRGDEKIEERSTLVGDYEDGPTRETFLLSGGVGGQYMLRVRLVDRLGSPVAERAATFQVSPRSVIARPGFFSRRSFAGTAGALALRRGKQLLRLSRAEEARMEFETAVAANNPDLPEARWQLAWILIQTGEAETARELLVPLEAGFPDQYEVVAGIGFAAYLGHDFSTAADYLKRAMTIRPADTTVLNALGDSLARLGSFERARDLLERSLEIDSQQGTVRKRLESIVAKIDRQGQLVAPDLWDVKGDRRGPVATIGSEREDFARQNADGIGF